MVENRPAREEIAEIAANIALRLLPAEDRRQHWHDARQVADDSRRGRRYPPAAGGTQEIMR